MENTRLAWLDTGLDTGLDTNEQKDIADSALVSPLSST